MRRRARWWPIIALLLAGGASLAADAADPAGPDLVWPRPPAPARIRYVRSVATPADWGVVPNVFARLADMLTGETPLRFVRPTGVAVRDKVLFVADPGVPALFVLDAERNEARQVRDAGGAPLVSPVAVAPGPGDTVFVADSALKAIIAFDRSGRPVRRISHPDLMRPVAVAYDGKSDRLYVADSQAHRIAVFSASGEFRESFGTRGSGDGEFNAPTHVALTRDGNLLVTDALNHRIQAFDAAGRFLRKVGGAGDGAGSFASPKGVAADGRGRIYVADALFDAVQIFRPDGALLLGFGERGTRPGQFSLPGGVYMDVQDTLYVADSYNHRIQVFERVEAGGAASDD
jgi:DNA-binding beta-propeller fold protein YncE